MKRFRLRPMPHPESSDAAPKVAERSTALPQPLSWQARGLLEGPDRRTRWVVILAATLARPIADLDDRVAVLHRSLPMLGARLRGGAWHPGEPPPVLRVDGEPLAHPGLIAAFPLAEQPPVRVLAGEGGHRLAFAAHHAAFDGLGLVAVLRALLGGSPPQPVLERPPGSPDSPWPALRRLLQPADRVAPSRPRPARESLVVREVMLSGWGVTARLAGACAEAAAAHTRARGRPWRQVGVSIGIGGPQGAGYVSSYRRVDTTSDGESVEQAVARALARPEEPFALVRPSAAMRLLAPISARFSDSLLVSNIGRHELPGATRLDFFPVARGRSAVAFGAAGLPGGPSTVTIRARDLNTADAAALLGDVVRRLHSRREEP